MAREKVSRSASYDAHRIAARVEEVLDSYTSAVLGEVQRAAEAEAPGSWLPVMIGDYLSEKRGVRIS